MSIGNALAHPYTDEDLRTFAERPYIQLSSLANGKYNKYPCMAQSPINNGIVIMTYIEGIDHVYGVPSVIKLQISYDRGVNYSAPVTIYNPGGVLCCLEQHNGFTINGRFHILCTLVDNIGVNSLIYLYSDDNGTTFTITDITATVADVLHPIFTNSSSLIENNGVLLSGFYRTNAGFLQTVKSVLRLVAGVWVLVDIDTTAAYENETWLETLGGNNLIALVRDEVTFNYIQYKSIDNGLNWTRLGYLIIIKNVFATGGVLTKFQMNNERIIAFYFRREDGAFNEYLYSLYAKASDLITYGLEGWNFSTLKIVDTFPVGTGQYQIGTALHYNNNYDAFIWIPKHINNSVANLKYFVVDTTDFLTINNYLFPNYSADIDSNAFNAVNPTNPAAIINLIGALKLYGLWNKIKAAYPIIGGTAALHKYNLKDPRDLDVAFRLTFTAGWVHAATGMTPNGINAYARTYLIPSLIMTLDLTGLSFYSRTNIIANQQDIGCIKNDPPNNFPSVSMINRYGDNKCYFYCYSDTGAFPDFVIGSIFANSLGNVTGSRISHTDNRIYYRGMQTGNTNIHVSLGIQPNIEIWIGGSNFSGVLSEPSSKECAFAAIHDGFTYIDAHNFNRLIQYYQTALGRNV